MGDSLHVHVHDGLGHGDEGMGLAVVRMARPGSTFTRSRNPADFERADVIMDVGGRNEVITRPDGRKQWWLDHHQTGGAGKRPNGVPYAACGLAWLHFGHECVRGDQEAFDRVDKALIQPIDAADNGFAGTQPTFDQLVDLVAWDAGIKMAGEVGVTINKMALCAVNTALAWRPEPRPLSYSAVVSLLNPIWNEERQDFDAAFRRMLWLHEDILTRYVKEAMAFSLAGDIVRGAEKTHNGRTLILDKFCPWQDEVFADERHNDVLYVIFKQPGERSSTWMVQAVPDRLGSFGKRKALPAVWGGKRDRDLAALTDVEDAVFCHPGLFIAGAGSQHGAIALAKLAVGG
jgi:uncharacterized UPF0160 family protein